MIKHFSELHKSEHEPNAKISIKVDPYEVEAQLWIDEEIDPAVSDKPMYYGWEFAGDILVAKEDVEEYIPFESLSSEEQKKIKKAIDDNIHLAEKYEE